ncbi:MAG: transporter substrate-binding domain-containing protein [Paludibacteraceae bacterium]|nr:transporter substrate-binding domain-containing protein [Paludibacteraceae bacterium]
MIRFLSICVIVTLIAGVFIFFYHREESQVWNPPVLRVITDYNSIDYFLSSDTVMGFQYELVERLCREKGWKAEWMVENSLQRSLEALANGEVDLIARSLPVTIETKEKVAFTIPILHFRQVLVQRSEETNNGKKPIRNQLQLAGKTVYVPEGSPNIMRLRNLSKEIADTIIIRQLPHYETEQLMFMVAHGDIDYVVCDEEIARKNIVQLPQLDINTAISFNQMQAWALRPSDTTLLHNIDSFLVRYIKSDEYKRLTSSYFR